MDFISQHRLYDGILYFIKHDSLAIAAPMTASVFVPDVAEQRQDAQAAGRPESGLEHVSSA